MIVSDCVYEDGDFFILKDKKGFIVCKYNGVGGKPMKGEYWSSTESSYNVAWLLRMSVGTRFNDLKGYDNAYVRPVLAF